MSGQRHFHGAAASHLSYTTQVACTALHHAASRELRQSTVANGMTIWYVLMVNDAFVTEENCQRHLNLALNLVCLFGLRDLESSIGKSGLLFPGHTRGPKIHHW